MLSKLIIFMLAMGMSTLSFALVCNNNDKATVLNVNGDIKCTTSSNASYTLLSKTSLDAEAVQAQADNDAEFSAFQQQVLNKQALQKSIDAAIANDATLATQQQQIDNLKKR